MEEMYLNRKNQCEKFSLKIFLKNISDLKKMIEISYRVLIFNFEIKI